MPKSTNSKSIKPTNEVVEAFRAQIEELFVRYQNFYDRTNVALRSYRLDHVALITQVYNELLTAKGDRLEIVRQTNDELNELIDAKIEEVGTNACVQQVLDYRDANSAAMNALVSACTVTANTTLSGLLTNVFYPTFAAIQMTTSEIPLSVIDVLSRGNVLEDEQAIIEYLNDRYSVFGLQWFGLVSQYLRWETNRFENEGFFLASTMQICIEEATWQYLLTHARLEGDIDNC